MNPLPTHSAQAIFKENGIRIQTGKIKFAAGDADKESAARAAVLAYLGPEKRNKTREIESIKIAPLPKPKLGAKLNEQHDYVTLKAVFLDGNLNLTTSWSGIKISGDFVGKPETDKLFGALIRFEKAQGNIVKKMKDLRDAAEGSQVFGDFLTKAEGVLKI